MEQKEEKIMEHLILYGYAGMEKQKLQDLQMFTESWEDCHLVLMQDAVVGTTTGENESTAVLEKFKNNGWKIYALQEDVIARGLPLEKIKYFIEPITYYGVIDLITDSKQLISWL
ncbi:MAG: hypothetical protein DRO88_07675 [Promethearchaeia archaeon]|nr:MAG: hypothetical protein DRO88_07675 [Candidatus Lokiarchaeia archaeon]